MKIVFVMNSELPVGLIANASAVLAISIGNKFSGIVGEIVTDGDGYIHEGITNLSLPILKGNSSIITGLRKKLIELNDGNIFYVDFCDIAQKSKDYSLYKQRLEKTPSEELNYLGIAIHGPAKVVTSLTGDLPLLK